MKRTKPRLWPDKTLWSQTVKPFLSGSPVVLWVMLLGLIAVFTILQTPNRQPVSFPYQVGDVVKRDLKAPADFFVEDREVTDAKRTQAREQVKNVYDFDDTLMPETLSRIESAMTFGQESIGTARADSETHESIPAPEQIRHPFEEKLGLRLNSAAFDMLYQHKFSSDTTHKIQAIVSRILTNGIVSNKEILLEDEGKGIVLRTIQSREERVVNTLKTFYSPEQAKAMVRIEGDALLKNTPGPLTGLIVEICQGVLQPNITLNKSETQKRIQDALSDIKPIMYQIKAGEMILREGERVDALSLMKVNALQAQVARQDLPLSVMGIALLSLFLILIPYRLFIKEHKTLMHDHNKHIAFLTLGLMLYLGFVKIAMLLAQTAEADQVWSLANAAMFMIIPLPAAAMICCLFLGFDIAIAFTLVLTCLASLMLGGSFEAFLFFFIGCISSAFFIRRTRDRKNFIRAGFKLALINAGMALCLGLYSFSQTDPLFLLRDMLMACCGGLLAAILTVGFTPFIETLFNYTTEARLMEFSNLDQPLIKKLMIEAPGTYNHSVIVATLAEAAASAISASSLKAKVMGYYHDVGKLDKTLYFIENQTDGKNRHDKLSPSMSALILIQHVKKGVELARQYKLGNEIIEGIVQHHGTSLIKYFYNKSLKSGKEKVNEEDFRYPGPKPQTREAGIVMLADVVEAAIRALERPTPARIQGRVKELINDIFADGQMEECELTLKDLHQIAKSFNTILTSIYHSRIEYPEKSQEKKKEKNGNVRDTDRQPAKTEGVSGINPPKDRTDLKRLGL
jgi:cyclic-di-AMP phosphodiesterase PgpH